MDFLCRLFCSSRRSSSAFDGGGGGGVRSPFPFPSSLLLPSPKRLSIVQSTPLSSRSLSNAAGPNARSSTFSASSGTGTEDDDTDDDDDDEDEEHDTWGWRRSPATETGEPSFRRFVDAFSKRRGVRGVRRRRHSVCDDARTWRRDLSGHRHRFALFKLVVTFSGDFLTY